MRYIEDYIRDVECLAEENAALHARVAELEKELNDIHVQEGGELPAPDDRQLGFRFGTPGCAFAGACSDHDNYKPQCSCGTVKCGRCQ